MALGWTITTQTYTAVAEADGTYRPVVEVGFKTTGEHPVTGTVIVDRDLVAYPSRYAVAVREAVEAAVSSHSAAAEMTGP